VAWQEAVGGAAIAHDIALGGFAVAEHANDAVARELFAQPLRLGFEWWLGNLAWLVPLYVVLLVLVCLAPLRLMYQRERPHSPRASEGPSMFWRMAVLALVAALGLGFLALFFRRGDPVESRAEEPKVERFQLKNGLSVLLRPVRGAKQTAVVVLYSIGGDHDPKGRSGLAHLLEHLYVTAAAGKAKARTADEYAKRYPAGWNAQTGDRYTVFATVVPEKELEQEVREAAWRMSDLRITAADLDREKPRIAEELANMFGRLPQLGALNHARELVRPTPLGGRKGGVPAHLDAITVKEAQDRWQRYYKPGNTLLVLAGALDVTAARKVVAEQFEKLPPGEVIPDPQEPGKPVREAMREIAVKPLAAHLGSEACLAYRAPAPGSELYAAYLVLVGRLQANAGKLEAGKDRFPVYCPLFDDPSVLGLTVPAQAKETAAQAEKRLRAFVAQTVEPRFAPEEVRTTTAVFGPMLGISDVADELLAANPYFVAFSLGRRQQLGIDPAALKAALAKLGEDDLRRAAREVFGPEQGAGVFLAVKK
jgi:zinc protease